MNTRAPTLVVLAAGMGSRYGGLKQFDAMGPHGETLLDYSVFDALRAGFARVVFVIRRDFAAAFAAGVGRRYGQRIAVDYVYQELADVPAGFRVPATRVRPWGTLHAVLAARHAVHGPFAVINADDFYGDDAFHRVARYFACMPPATDGVDHYCMVGYPIRPTLSAHGGVNRGLCVERDGFLTGVEEYTAIAAGADGVCRGIPLGGKPVELPGNAVVSMNFWGFTASVFSRLERYFADFLEVDGGSLDAECYIPSAVDQLIRCGEADCRILRTDSRWFGVTYPQDKPASVARLRALIAEGVYKDALWA